jgi:hypothetical protein
VSISSSSARLSIDQFEKEEAMKYMLLIHQGTTPLPGSPEWERLSSVEQRAVYADYRAINETPGVTPGVQMQPPDMATTVRVEDGRTLTTDGPFVAVKEALGGYLFFEAGDLDAAIELAARIPAARLGGAVEVRPLLER